MHDAGDWLRRGEVLRLSINEVYECVTVTGCSRVSLEDANVAGIMVLDVEKSSSARRPLAENLVRTTSRV